MTFGWAKLVRIEKGLIRKKTELQFYEELRKPFTPERGERNLCVKSH